ncbi:MAG: DUF63 family protein [Candidatus Aenigmatarchaeota archaeon]
MFQDFFQTYYIDPIKYGTGYNIVNTLTYAIILILAAFGTYKLLKKMQIKIDKKFFFAIMPFIALGGMLRAFEDLSETIAAAKNPFLITPLIYFTVFAIALLSLIVSIIVRRYAKIGYHKTWFSIGTLSCIVVLLSMAMNARQIQPNALLIMAGISVMWLAVLYGVKLVTSKTRMKGFMSTENFFLLFVHMFDATTTFTALQFFPNYFEQHVLPGFFINMFGPAVIFVLKFAIVGAVLYFLDKDLSKPQDIEKRNFLKIVIMILGLGPGLRNFFRLVLGV